MKIGKQVSRNDALCTINDGRLAFSPARVSELRAPSGFSIERRLPSASAVSGANIVHAHNYCHLIANNSHLPRSAFLTSVAIVKRGSLKYPDPGIVRWRRRKELIRILQMQILCPSLFLFLINTLYLENDDARVLQRIN